MNGHAQGNGSAKGKNVVLEKELPKGHEFDSFDQPIVLRQSPVWARAVIWTIVGVTTFGLAWASIAELEEIVSAQGQLKPEGAVKEVQVPVNGVVKKLGQKIEDEKKVYIKEGKIVYIEEGDKVEKGLEEVPIEEGDKVEKGQILFILDDTAAKAQLESLQKVRDSLSQENEFYDALMTESVLPGNLEVAISALNPLEKIASLARNRMALLEENQLYRALLNVPGAAASLNGQQLSRLAASRAEYNSRVAASRLEVEQLEKQLGQNQVQLKDTRERLATDRLVLGQIEARNRQAITQARQSLSLEEKVLASVVPLVAEGALAQIQMERQQQEVNDRRAALVDLESNGQIEYDRQKQEVETRLAEIQQLEEEEQRLRLDITQAREELTNTMALSERDVRDNIARNDQQIAAIDSQLSKTVVENDKRIAEIKSEISRTEVTLDYQEVKAPIEGTVFDLQVGPGSVPNPNLGETAVKIVPDETLIAEVFVTNQDIGFVREGQMVDVRIDSFPYHDFGDIKGEVILVGEDALEPDQIYQFYRFPVKVSLNRQDLLVGEQAIPLQSGMSITANIKIREHRKVIALLFDMFNKRVDSLKNLR